jgi:NAD(P)-dependent dehydrogenase (short-subunit alcohol dehydrogenase family)
MRALVTGAAGGIGAAIAARLAADGLDVVGVDRAEADLADASAVAGLARDAGAVDVLVNCAADFSGGRLEELELATWRRVQAVNVEAPLLLCRALAPGMRERGWGRIVNVVSDTFHRPPAAGMCAYIASKGALIGLTRALAVELGGDGVTVNAVAPGLTRTAPALRDVPPEQFEAVRRAQAVPRALQPEDYAGPVSFLVSGDAATMTGQTLCPDAGLVYL